jgi:DNA polymerase-3 subunit gamma/tau
MILRGEAAAALTELSEQYADGADPMAVLRDLAEVCHWISVIKITPEAAEDPTIGPDERTRGQAMAADLPMRVMSRMWQMLLKALEEVAIAPNAMMAAEMAVIRLTHVADLPSPEELVRKLQDATPPPSGPSGARAAPKGGGGATAISGTVAPTHSGPSGPSASGAQTAVALQTDPLQHYARFEDVVELIRMHRDVKLLVEVETGLRLVSYQPGRIEVNPTPDAARDLVGRLGARLQAWTGNRWAISVADGGTPTIAQTRDAAENAVRAQAQAHPLVQAVIAAFPKAKITDIRTEADKTQEAFEDALPEVDDEWDPFDED